MGYMTRFNVTIIEGEFPEFEQKLIAQGYSTVERIIAKEAPTLNGYNPFQDQTKWYDYAKDMIEVSLKYPEIIFEISGEGEESGDIWRHYFKNGRDKRICPEMVWPVFDILTF